MAREQAPDLKVALRSPVWPELALVNVWWRSWSDR